MTMMIQGLIPSDVGRVKIVADNAKSHVSKTQTPTTTTIRSLRRIRSTPTVAVDCRWGCGAAPQDSVPLVHKKLRGPATATTTKTTTTTATMISLPPLPSHVGRGVNKTVATTTTTNTMPMTRTTSLSNVMKPVRRRSLDDAEILSELLDSLSSLDKLYDTEEANDDTSLANKTAGELIALALQEMESSFALLEESTTS